MADKNKVSKADRRKMIKALVEDETLALSEDKVVAEVTKVIDIKAETVVADIREMYPDGLAVTELNPDAPALTTNDGEDLEVPASAYTDPNSTAGAVPTNLNTGRPNVSTADGKEVQVRQPDENPELLKGRKDPKNYKVKKEEKRFVHVEVEATQFNAVTGVKRSKPKVVKLTPPMWPKFRDAARGNGFTHMVVLHAPEGVDVTVDPAALALKNGIRNAPR